MALPESVVIVGAGLAGLRTAETLRALGYEGRLSLVGAEPELPYERPALSKEFLTGRKSQAQLSLRSAEFFEQEGIELTLGRRAEKVAAGRHLLVLDDGSELRWDALVIATGSRPRKLPVQGGALRNLIFLRTLADALELRRRLDEGGRLAMIGAGFVGTEVASTAVARGLDVTLVDPLPLPFERTLGAEVGVLLRERYRDHGVDLRLGRTVSDLAGGVGGGGRLRLDDHSQIEFDTAIAGIGAEPAGELLGRGGIATDASGRTKLPGIYACGDVAEAWRPSLGRRLRIEHWTNAAGQAAAVARSILGEECVHDDVPFFWSDQFGLRLQYVGYAGEWARVELDGDGDSFSARYFDERGRLLAALAANRPAEIAALRRELAEPAPAPASAPSSSRGARSRGRGRGLAVQPARAAATAP